MLFPTIRHRSYTLGNPNAEGSHNLELRSSQDVHDRHIFVDDRCWTVGQSIKDAAKKKPTYMVGLSANLVPMMRSIYEGLWSKATVVVKS